MVEYGFEYGLYQIADMERIRNRLGSEANNQTNTYIKLEIYFFYANNMTKNV
jgi:hypothetical protein